MQGIYLVHSIPSEYSHKLQLVFTQGARFVALNRYAARQLKELGLNHEVIISEFSSCSWPEIHRQIYSYFKKWQHKISSFPIDTWGHFFLDTIQADFLILRSILLYLKNQNPSPVFYVTNSHNYVYHGVLCKFIKEQLNIQVEPGIG